MGKNSKAQDHIWWNCFGVARRPFGACAWYQRPGYFEKGFVWIRNFFFTSTINLKQVYLSRAGQLPALFRLKTPAIKKAGKGH